MLPVHRAQLATAMAQFQADIRRLVQSTRPEDRERLLITLDPTRARSAKGAAGARNRAAPATRTQPAGRARRAAARTRVRRAVTQRSLGIGAAASSAEAGMRTDAAMAAVRTESTGERTSSRESAAQVPAASPVEPGTSAPPPVESTGAPGATESAGSAAGAGAEPGVKSVSGLSGSKRVRWTRETIVEELARWMLTGSALDASFVRRHGPPGLVSAALRIFGRFDAALNVAGLHVAKLDPGDGAGAKPGNIDLPGRRRRRR
jgi:hypothetical protein